MVRHDSVGFLSLNPKKDSTFEAQVKTLHEVGHGLSGYGGDEASDHKTKGVMSPLPLNLDPVPTKFSDSFLEVLKKSLRTP